MKKEWLFVLICHIVNWLVFSATDYLAEEWGECHSPLRR